MKKKIVGIFVCMLMIVATVLPVASTINLDKNQSKGKSVSPNDKSPVPLQINHCLWSGIGSNLFNTAVSPAIDFTTATTWVMTLWKQYNISSPDSGFIQASTDGGVTWSTLEAVSGLVPDWTINSVDLSAYAGQSDIKIRFLYDTQSGSSSKGWHVDDVTITGDGSVKYVEKFETGAPGWTLTGWTIVEKHPPKTKWEQLPDTNSTGIDICVDRYDTNYTRMLADDFLCISPGHITNITLWGSWKNDNKGTINQFHLSIHKDIPANQSGTGYSMPGDLLWQRDFSKGQFTETGLVDITEWWWDPYTQNMLVDHDQSIYQYDFIIPWNDAFNQTGTSENPIIYWLDVYVNSTNGNFGWKTSLQHWNDDAVMNKYGYTPPWFELRYPINHQQYANQSIDMAFRLITTPKPVKLWDVVTHVAQATYFKVDIKNLDPDEDKWVDWTIEAQAINWSPWPVIPIYPPNPNPIWHGNQSIKANETVTIKSGLFLAFESFNLTIKINGITLLETKGFNFFFIIFVKPPNPNTYS